MQDKRRRNDFASTEVGEATGGRVTQQAFDEKRDACYEMAKAATAGSADDEMCDPDEPIDAKRPTPLTKEELDHREAEFIKSAKPRDDNLEKMECIVRDAIWLSHGARPRGSRC